jgi:hypothetical protein
VLLVRTSDYTATNGTSVVLASGAIASDTLVVVAYGAFNVSNTYTQAQADARYPLNSIDLSAGKNKIINGDCAIWQRGTSFTFSATGGYTADRFELTSGGGGVVTVTREVFTSGTAPVAGYEGTYYINANYTSSGTTASDNGQYIEDVRTFAGQTVTMSVWVKVSTGTHNITPQMVQRFGSGGSGAGATSGTTFTATTSWQRYSATVTVPSVSGKTIGAGSSLQFRLDLGTTGVKQFSYWGWQVEAGSVATAFQTASGSVGGELALCQRYYETQDWAGSTYRPAVVYAANQQALTYTSFAVVKRATPSINWINPNTARYVSNNGVPSPTQTLLASSTTVSGTSIYTTATFTLAGAGWIDASATMTISAEL